MQIIYSTHLFAVAWAITQNRLFILLTVALHRSTYKLIIDYMEVSHMDRRTFLINSTLAAAGTTLSNSSIAAPELTLPPENLIYTEKNGGKWQSKTRLHIPIIEVGNNKIMIRTEHGQSERHYIVRHTLLLEDGTVVGASTFTSNDAPMSDYELPAGYKGKIFATSFCNKHDLWLSEITV
jgi:superoxide reductase